jgi:hypothetical protein
LKGSKTSLTCNNDKSFGVLWVFGNSDGLDEAMLFNRVSEFLERLVVKIATRLIRIWPKLYEVNFDNTGKVGRRSEKNVTTEFLGKRRWLKF